VADLAKVDKVIIAQNSIQRFINSVSPGAFASITKVDFKTLDRFMIKPFGVYGSKDEIVRLLQGIGAIDDNVHMANTIQFVYELQKAGKQFQLMLYPKSRHGVTDPVLVKHWRTMMTEYVLANL